MVSDIVQTHNTCSEDMLAGQVQGVVCVKDREGVVCVNVGPNDNICALCSHPQASPYVQFAIQLMEVLRQGNWRGYIKLLHGAPYLMAAAAQVGLGDRLLAYIVS